MARGKRPTLPKTRVVDGHVLVRDVRPFTVTYKGLSRIVQMPGYWPKEKGKGEAIFIGSDMEPGDQALAELKREVEGIPTPREIKRIRTERLRLSQAAASDILKVGPKAFAKYETGRAMPSGPTVVLLRLLDQQPQLVRLLGAEPARKAPAKSVAKADLSKVAKGKSRGTPLLLRRGESAG